MPTRPANPIERLFGTCFIHLFTTLTITCMFALVGLMMGFVFSGTFAEALFSVGLAKFSLWQVSAIAGFLTALARMTKLELR